MNLTDPLFILLQRIIPQHWLSNQMYKLMRCEIPWVKNFLIKMIIKQYNVDMSIAAEQDIDQFVHFNDFFVRELKPTARPFTQSINEVSSPVDGAVSQAGAIADGRVFQAKGKSFSLASLLANDTTLIEEFSNGQFATLYLSPRDYHRIHMPIDGQLRKMIYVPGDLFAVNQRTVANVDELFARNERTICIFDTAQGPMAMILVGAIFVGSMQTVWHEGTITPPYGKQIQTWDYDGSLNLKKGEEMGRFNMGSTVVLLFGQDQLNWIEELQAGKPLKMGELIGTATA